MPYSISVVIPAFNGSRYIGEALQSIFVQTVLPLEIIVVDDASTDDTLDVARRVCTDGPVPLLTVRLMSNTGGPAAPINAGIQQARGDLIAVLDQDDVFLPAKLQEQAAAFRQDADLTLVFGCCAKLHKPGELFQSAAIREKLIKLGTPAGSHVRLAGSDALHLLLTLAQENFILGYPGFMFRRKHWEQKGGVDESLTIASDLDLLCWLFTQGPAGFIDRAHYLRRQHDQNLTNRTLAMWLDVAIVRERYLNGRRRLSLDPSEAEAMKGQFECLAYWLREAGRYREARYCLRLANRIWGWDMDRALAAAKIVPHWLLHRLGLRPPRVEVRS
jgi:teichuronic acid biosynthesis glycosyltransferase TuaG